MDAMVKSIKKRQKVIEANVGSILKSRLNPEVGAETCATTQCHFELLRHTDLPADVYK